MAASQKIVVCDSSTLISLTATCNARALQYLKERSKVRFIASPWVYEESVGRPLKMHRYEYSAVRIKKSFRDKVVEVQETEGLEKETQEIMFLGNNLFSVGGRALTLIQIGEVESMALMIKNNTNYMAVDEKTMRLLIENPMQLRNMLKSEYNDVVEVNKENLKKWQEKVRGMLVIRSTEILAQAVKKGMYRDFGEDENLALHSALQALRSAGCSLSERELEEYRGLKTGV